MGKSIIVHISETFGVWHSTTTKRGSGRTDQMHRTDDG